MNGGEKRAFSFLISRKAPFVKKSTAIERGNVSLGARRWPPLSRHFHSHYFSFTSNRTKPEFCDRGVGGSGMCPDWSNELSTDETLKIFSFRSEIVRLKFYVSQKVLIYKSTKNWLDREVHFYARL